MKVWLDLAQHDNTTLLAFKAFYRWWLGYVIVLARHSKWYYWPSLVTIKAKYYVKSVCVLSKFVKISLNGSV
jgi:hypothetical protein